MRLSLVRTLLIVSIGVGCLFSGARLVSGAGDQPNASRLTKLVLGVSDLNRTCTFYRALGMSLTGATEVPQATPLPGPLLKLVDVPAGTRFRNVMMSVPGAQFALEATEFSNMTLRPGAPRLSDPGAAVLILPVHDLGAALAAARSADGQVVTTGGAPVHTADDTTAIVVRDPDGYYVELVQTAGSDQAGTAPTGAPAGARFGSVVSDAAKAAGFYRDRFGMDARITPWSSEVNLLKLAGVSGEFRIAHVQVPGAPGTWSFIEFRGVDSKPYALRIPDPGAPVVGLEVRDLSRAADAMNASGGSVITTGDGRIQAPNGGLVSFTRDPNGILVELAQSGAPAPSQPR